MPDPQEPDILHDFKNQLFIMATYSKLLLADLPGGDPRYSSVLEMNNAIRDAVALLPELAGRMR